ncbi:serine aminopeptidase domain-containing protein [Spiroplasma endosymbiont of Polydrusus formosus]|uniref:serine aminopeptidase domain-containing protein n=1 Tax=Spiroplasma endosymbiont of Polydrusus formosus TaxID=3139326 RepID=UPI0035B511A1
MAILIKTNVIIIGVCITIGIFLCCYLFYRFYRLLKTKTKHREIQLPEYIENKYFITADQYQLTTLGTIDKTGEYIILAVHDLYGQKENFRGLINNAILVKNKVSVIAFNQRNVGNNEPTDIKNVGMLVNDIIDVIAALKNKYEQQKVIILLEGFAGCLINLILKQKPTINQVFFVNPITNQKGMHFSMISKIVIVFGFLFNLNKIMNISIDYQFLSQNKKYCTLMMQDKQSYFLNQVLQFNYLNKKIVKQINNVKMKILIVQAEADKFYNAKTAALIKEEKGKIVKISTAKHYLFTDENINAIIFTEIINLI